jgi:hypothetical protein
MRTKIQRLAILVVLVATLMAALIVGFAKIGSQQTTFSGQKHTPQLAGYCPAPPVEC